MTREEANAILQRTARATGLRVESVHDGDAWPREAPPAQVYSSEKLAGHWIALVTQTWTPALQSSRVLGVSKATGEVIDFGSANDEG